ncbi:MAG: tRNA (guanosine(46)-N7)-methyltransferase TrmB, partial [Granulosicoccaceae bacterium]
MCDPIFNDAGEEVGHPRRIRSFVRRGGRLTTSQQKALDECYPVFGVKPGLEPIDPVALFGRDAPLWVEVGIGNGDALVAMAAAHPEKNFLGIEVHRAGVGHCLFEVNRLGLNNVRLIEQDAIEVLNQRLPEACVDRFLLFFPDPWHKKRHKKRRIVSAVFAQTVSRLLQDNGIWHLATDWEDYAHHMVDVLAAEPSFRNMAGEQGPWSPRPQYRPYTRF